MKKAKTKTGTPRRDPVKLRIVDLGEDQFHYLVLYGESGVGKTVLAGSAPNAVIFEVEPQAAQSARQFGSTARKVVTPDWNHIEAIPNFIRSQVLGKYEWVVVDSITDVDERCMRGILKEEHARNPKMRRLDRPALADYGVRDNRVKAFVEELFTIPINVILTAHTFQLEVPDPDDDTETFLSSLPLLGSTNNARLSRWLCGKASGVLHMTSEQRIRGGKVKTVRSLRTDKTKTIFAKNRIGLAPKIRVKDLGTLLQLEKGSETT